MKSLYEFMRQKHLTEAVRCSLENFAELRHCNKKDNGALRHVKILPLFATSNLYDVTDDTAIYAEKAQQEIDQMWEDGTLNQEKLDELRGQHLRTPFKNL